MMMACFLSRRTCLHVSRSKLCSYFRSCTQSNLPVSVETKLGVIKHRCFASTNKSLPVLTLYTKNPCPLCDDAVDELQPYKHRFSLEKVDITQPENKDWYKKYRFDIPVFHFDGSFLMKHRVDHDKLQRKLSSWEQD